MKLTLKVVQRMGGGQYTESVVRWKRIFLRDGTVVRKGSDGNTAYQLFRIRSGLVFVGQVSRCQMAEVAMDKRLFTDTLSRMNDCDAILLYHIVMGIDSVDTCP